MSVFSWIKSETTGVFDALVPADMRAELGTLAHGFAANVQYDAQQLGHGVQSISAGAMSEIWTAVKSAVATALHDPAFAQAAMDGKIDTAIAVLTSDAAKSFVPALKIVGQTTLTNMAHAASAMVISGVLANPTSPPVSSPAGSLGALSAGSGAPSTTAASNQSTAPANAPIAAAPSASESGAAS